MNLTTSDSQITSEKGTLFARTWRPLEVSFHRNETILLFHDSLGCVDLCVGLFLRSDALPARIEKNSKAHRA
jgi:hypothetical protein